jgi:hypothetical protein
MPTPELLDLFVRPTMMSIRIAGPESFDPNSRIYEQQFVLDREFEKIAHRVQPLLSSGRRVQTPSQHEIR